MRAFSQRFKDIDPHKNYYRIMKLKENATPYRVGINYKQLAKFYQKDENAKEDIHEEKRRLLEEAYEVLRQPEKRQQYNTIRGPEEETKQAKEKWEKMEREDEFWKAKYQYDRICESF